MFYFFHTFSWQPNRASYRLTLLSRKLSPALCNVLSTVLELFDCIAPFFGKKSTCLTFAFRYEGSDKGFLRIDISCVIHPFTLENLSVVFQKYFSDSFGIFGAKYTHLVFKKSVVTQVNKFGTRFDSWYSMCSFEKLRTPVEFTFS